MNVIKQRDPSDALGVAALQYEQAKFAFSVAEPDHDGREITRVVVAGMGGSALAALLVKSWLHTEIVVPFEIVRSYDLPGYVDYNTLVIISSYSGNTEETISCLHQAREKSAQVAIVASGGSLAEIAQKESISHVLLPQKVQPRMAVINGLRAMVALLAHFGVVNYDRFAEIASSSEWLRQETAKWLPTVSTHENYAKQLAVMAAGKTAVIYGSPLTSAVAYKWKISWNENAKNMAFWNEYPEFNHNEFIGWSGQPIDKPFAVFDLVSGNENSQILKRFELSDRLLSGMRPKATTITLQGDTVLKQMLWGSILADFTSIYLAIINGNDPMPVALVEKLKKELA